MRFCPYCGAPVVPAGKFCVECGRQLEQSSSGRIKGLHLTAAFVGVFLGIVLVGLMIVYLIVPGTQPAKVGLASSEPVAPDQGQQQAAENLPPGHPKVELPAEARTFLDQVEKEAKAKPSDIALWNRYGEVALRAAMIDPSYYSMAEEGYGHALKLNPDDPDALRGIGNIDYDRKQYDQAIAAYEHYLKERPNDPEVRTDLGTMYLYTGNPDQAVVQYKKAVAQKPDFFEAYFNMGVAYGAQNDAANARKAFEKAITVAPDDTARSKAKEMMAKIGGGGPQIASASGGGSSAPKASVRAKADSAGASGAFHGAVEEMLRNLPVAGPKVASVAWPEKYKAMVMMANFPMNAMPPFAKQKFLDDVKDGIKKVKSENNVKDTVVVDIDDGATGEVMQTVSE